MDFFISLIHSFISYGIATVQRPSHPSPHSFQGQELNIYCVKGTHGALWRTAGKGRLASSLERPEAEFAAHDERCWMAYFSNAKRGRCAWRLQESGTALVMGWGLKTFLRDPSFSDIPVDWLKHWQHSWEKGILFTDWITCDIHWMISALLKLMHNFQHPWKYSSLLFHLCCFYSFINFSAFNPFFFPNARWGTILLLHVPACISEN